MDEDVQASKVGQVESNMKQIQLNLNSLCEGMEQLEVTLIPDIGVQVIDAKLKLKDILSRIEL